MSGVYYNWRRRDREHAPNRRLKNEYRALRFWQPACALLALAALVFRQTLIDSPAKVEYGYSRGVYPYLSDAMAMIGRLAPAPISVAELAAGALLAWIVAWLILRLAGVIRGGAPALKLPLAIVANGAGLFAALFFIYLMGWGLNYLREPFYTSLAEDAPTHPRPAPEAYVAMAREMVERLLRMPPVAGGPWDVADLDAPVDRAVAAVVAAATDSAWAGLPPRPPPTKQLMANWLLAATGIKGFFSPFTMEPHVAAGIPGWDRPCLMAHEKAHFLGFASEADATLIAYIACLTSDDQRLRYSGALNVMLALSRHIPPPDRPALIKGLPAGARADVERLRAYFRENHRRYPRLHALRRRINDWYLRANSQQLGMASYDASLGQLVAWWLSGLEAADRAWFSPRVPGAPDAPDGPASRDLPAAPAPPESPGAPGFPESSAPPASSDPPRSPPTPATPANPESSPRPPGALIARR